MASYHQPDPDWTWMGDKFDEDEWDDECDEDDCRD